MKMIDIVIPAYKAHDTIYQTLCSIAYQTIKDLCNVTIVNDDPNDSYQKEIELFSNFLDIQEITLDVNSGPGVARQVGIDSTHNPYLVFIDSDDIFVNPFAIETLYKYINRGQHDVVVGNFYCEYGLNFYIHENDTVWLHGKIYLRKYLEDHNIRFSKSRSNEDTGFNHCVLMHNPNIYFIGKPIYVWCYRSDSITRNNNNEYDITQLPGFMYSLTCAARHGLEENADKNYLQRMAFWALHMLYLNDLEYKDVPLYHKTYPSLYKESKYLVNYYLLHPYRKEEVEEECKAHLEELKKKCPNLDVYETFDEYLHKIIDFKEEK